MVLDINTPCVVEDIVWSHFQMLWARLTPSLNCNSSTYSIRSLFLKHPRSSLLDVNILYAYSWPHRLALQRRFMEIMLPNLAAPHCHINTHDANLLGAYFDKILGKTVSTQPSSAESNMTIGFYINYKRAGICECCFV